MFYNCRRKLLLPRTGIIIILFSGECERFCFHEAKFYINVPQFRCRRFANVDCVGMQIVFHKRHFFALYIFALSSREYAEHRSPYQPRHGKCLCIKLRGDFFTIPSAAISNAGKNIRDIFHYSEVHNACSARIFIDGRVQCSVRYKYDVPLRSERVC